MLRLAWIKPMKKIAFFFLSMVIYSGYSQNIRSLNVNTIHTYVEIPTSSMLNLSTGDFTLEAWVKPSITTNDGFQTVISNRQTHTNGFLFGLFWGYPELYIKGDLVGSGANTPDLRGNVWHHVAVTRNNGNIIYYDASNSANSWLAGKTITLSGGGELKPLQ